MVDHIKTLLLNPTGVAGYRHVDDTPADTALELFGVKRNCNDEAVIDILMPLIMADDLSMFRTFYDTRLSVNTTKTSVYRHEYSSCGDCGSCASLSLDGIRDRVLGNEGWWTISSLFSSDNTTADANLAKMRQAASSADAPFALGAVLLACAYRRFILQGGS